MKILYISGNQRSPQFPWLTDYQDDCLLLGLKEIYLVDVNPLPWLDEILNGVEHTNFFENRATDYAKGAVTGNWGDVWAN